MEDYQNILSTRIMQQLYPEKVSLLEIARRIDKKDRSLLIKKEKESLPLIDPELVSTLAVPLVVIVIGRLISELILKATERKLKDLSKDQIATIVVNQKKGLDRETLEISIKRGIKKRTISEVLKDVNKLIGRNPEILYIDYRMNKKTRRSRKKHKVRKRVDK